MSIGLIWFGNDLRSADQALLWQAASKVDQLVCLYCADNYSTRQSVTHSFSIGYQRDQFQKDSINELAMGLAELGQTLFFSSKSADHVIPLLLNELPISHIFRNHHPGWYEQQTLNQLRCDFSDVEFHILSGLSLFSGNELPFAVDELPNSFSKFRKLVEPLDIAPPAPEISALPPIAPFVMADVAPWLIQNRREKSIFNGGEMAALTQLSDYFATGLPSTYKETRNELDGWENSTKFSPWLAQGNISPKQIKACLDVYERDHGANDSTYWIYFELLWREYFHWYATRYGKRLFLGQGIQGQRQHGSFYPERFRKWCQGNTPYPIVNACMKQLNETGFMTNRGRQLVASCLIYDLGIDWRYGAAYFESQLVDYDVGSNWGNWQYIAGVGADPRGGRHFNLDKQTQMYDPNHSFIAKWNGHQCDQQLDSVDAADWPISP